MTQFEYLSVAVSIIFALSIGRLSAAIPSVVDAHRRDWLHLGHFLCLLLVQMQFWWRMWQFNDVPEWDFFGFVMLFSIALLYYLATHLLVPVGHSDVGDWRTHFSSMHRWYHGIVAMTWGSSVAVSAYLMGFYALPFPMLITMALFFAAIVFDRRWFHFMVLTWWVLLLGVISFNLQRGAA